MCQNVEDEKQCNNMWEVKDTRLLSCEVGKMRSQKCSRWKVTSYFFFLNIKVGMCTISKPDICTYVRSSTPGQWTSLSHYFTAMCDLIHFSINSKAFLNHQQRVIES